MHTVARSKQCQFNFFARCLNSWHTGFRMRLGCIVITNVCLLCIIHVYRFLPPYSNAAVVCKINITYFYFRAGGKTPVLPGRGRGSRMLLLRGFMLGMGKNFLGACRCVTVVVL